ncbi:hypothetical protein ABF236_000829 [Yersinia ruckeri]
MAKQKEIPDESGVEIEKTIPAEQLEGTDTQLETPDGEDQAFPGDTNSLSTTVVVLKGRSVKHNDKLYLESNTLVLDDLDDVVTLIDAGFVITLDALRKQATAREAAGAPMIQVNNGVIVTQEG